MVSNILRRQVLPTAILKASGDLFQDAHLDAFDRGDAQVKQVPEDWWLLSTRICDVFPIARLMLKGKLAYREGRFEDAWAALEKGIEAEAGGHIARDAPWHRMRRRHQDG